MFIWDLKSYLTFHEWVQNSTWEPYIELWWKPTLGFEMYEWTPTYWSYHQLIDWTILLRFHDWMPKFSCETLIWYDLPTISLSSPFYFYRGIGNNPSRIKILKIHLTTNGTNEISIIHRHIFTPANHIWLLERRMIERLARRRRRRRRRKGAVNMYRTLTAKASSYKSSLIIKCIMKSCFRQRGRRTGIQKVKLGMEMWFEWKVQIHLRQSYVTEQRDCREARQLMLHGQIMLAK